MSLVSVMMASIIVPHYHAVIAHLIKYDHWMDENDNIAKIKHLVLESDIYSVRLAKFVTLQI